MRDNYGQINGDGTHDNNMNIIGRPPPRDLSAPGSRQGILDKVPAGEKFRFERVNDPETVHFTEEMKDFLIRNGRLFDGDIIDLVGAFRGVTVYTKEQVKQGRGGDYYLIMVGADDGIRLPAQ